MHSEGVSYLHLVSCINKVHTNLLFTNNRIIFFWQTFYLVIRTKFSQTCNNLHFSVHNILKYLINVDDYCSFSLIFYMSIHILQNPKIAHHISNWQSSFLLPSEPEIFPPILLRNLRDANICLSQKMSENKQTPLNSKFCIYRHFFTPLFYILYNFVISIQNLEFMQGNRNNYKKSRKLLLKILQGSTFII